MCAARARKHARSLSKGGITSQEEIDRLRFAQDWTNLSALLLKGDPFGDNICEYPHLRNNYHHFIYSFFLGPIYYYILLPSSLLIIAYQLTNSLCMQNLSSSRSWLLPTLLLVAKWPRNSPVFASIPLLPSSLLVCREHCVVPHSS